MARLFRLFLVAVALAAGLVVPVQAGQGDYTLIVAPARYSVIQMSFDLIKKRSAVLVSYRGEATTAEPLLYAWNGTEWVYVSLQDYREVRFVQDPPKQVVLLGDENTLPASLKQATGWAKNVQTVKALDNAALVNEFGRLFKWSKEEWQWFAGRYNLSLQDESEPYRKSSWYDQPGPLPRGAYKKVIDHAPAFEPTKAPTAPEMPPVQINEIPPLAPVIPAAPAENAKAPPATLPAAIPDAPRP